MPQLLEGQSAEKSVCKVLSYRVVVKHTMHEIFLKHQHLKFK